jgi:septum formation protein
LTGTEIRAYVRSSEWQGKAGAYAIQEQGGGLVATLHGDFDNVVGLPVSLIHDLLREQFSHCRFL